MLLKTKSEWHDLRVDPDDLPGEEEPILVTVELLSGNRVTWLDVYLKYGTDDQYYWVTKAVNEYGKIEETVVWYPVIAWAYPPAPFDFY